MKITLRSLRLGCLIVFALVLKAAAGPTNCVTPPPGLIGWWPGENNANDIAGTNNGVLVGGTTFAAGVVGQAFNFDGISNAVTNPVPGLTNVLNSYTMEFWAWPTASRATTSESTDTTDGDSGQRYAIFPANGRFGNVGSGVSVGTNGVSVVELGNAYMPALLVYDTTITNWTHVAVIYSNQQPNLYLNGVLVHTGLTSTRSSYPSTCFGDAGFGFGFYAGLLDEVSIYNRSLSGAEVASIFNVGSFGKCTPPIPPFIVLQPTNQTVTIGSTATFTSVAGGTSPLAYQWTFFGSNIVGATTSSLALTNVQMAQAGPYVLHVTNAFGATNSVNAVLTVMASSPCAATATNIIAWWRMETTALDSIGTNNGSLTGTIDFVPGEVGLGLYMDQVQEGISVPDGPALNFGPGADFSIEAWIQPLVANTSFGVMNIVDKRNAPNISQSQGYEFDVVNGVLGCLISASIAGNGIIVNAGPDLRDGSFHHVALTLQRNSTTGGHLYVDGTSYLTFDPTSQAGDLGNSSPLLVGMHPTYPTVDGNFRGTIDEVSIYRRALTAAEIQNIYAYGSAGKCAAPFIFSQPTNQAVLVGSNVLFSVLASGTAPLSYQWRFNDTNISGATSSSLLLTNAQVTQAGTYSVQVVNSYGQMISSNALLAFISCVAAPSNLISWWRAETNAWDQLGGNTGSIAGGLTFGNGIVGRTFVFDGNGSVVNLGNPTNLQLQDFTIETWIRRTGTTSVSLNGNGNGTIFGYDSSGYGLYLDPSGRPNLTKTGVSATSPGITITDTNFHHLAVTKSGSVVIFYVDGVGYSAPSYNPGFTFGGQAYIGGLGGNYSFWGSVDELSVYSRSLSGSEIQGIYTASIAGKCLVGSAPLFTVQPTNQTTQIGLAVSFSAAAGGTPPISYQWAFQGTNIPGATGASLILSGLQTNQSGVYAVLASNGFGTLWSSNALLTVLPPVCTPTPSNLVSWWRAETNAWDQIGGNSGTLSNNVTFTNGAVGQGFVFDGNGAVVRIGNPANLQLQDFTIETWIRRSSTSVVSLNGNGNGHIFGYDNAGYGLYLDPSGRPNLTKTGVGATSPGVTITDTNFHHLAVTKSGSTVVFYLDGTSFSATAYNPGFTFGGTAWIGGLGNNNNFLGSIDEVAFYSRALSATEIQAIYSAISLGKCVVAYAPFFVVQATNRTALVGSSTTFFSSSGGTPPLYYQWRLNGTNITGATANSLTLTNVQMRQAGNYSLLVSNLLISIPSTNATLTVNFPTPVVRIAATNSSSGGAVTIPVSIVANGNENGLAFSLTFEPAKLGYTGVTLGSGAPGAFLITNTSLINSGKLGVSVALPPGATFSPGTQQVARISFLAATLPTNAIATNTFGDQPTPRQLLDNQLNTLPAAYSNGTVSVSAAVSYEGDVFPRPNGDTNTTLADWLILGRYAARLDYPTNAAEFQRADCAPRATLGDGTIKVTDWVQAGRYAAGFETLTPAGGPTNEQVTAGPAPSASRLVTSSDATVVQGQSTTVSVTLTAQGNENALGFSLSFDPTLATFAGATLGGGGSGATLYVNSSQAASGRLGFALALSTGASYPAGAKELVRLNFQATPAASGGFAAAFGDLPVPREVSDAGANALPVSFMNGNVTVTPPPSLLISQAGTNVVLSWPIWANNFILQECVATLPPAATWSNLPVTPLNIGNSSTVTLPLGSSPRYYRLRSP
jgi:hypothetical protein